MCRRFLPDEGYLLWDGERYCRDCLDAESAGLADYSRAHPSLDDVMPYSPWMIGRAVMKVAAFVVLAFLVAANAVAWSDNTGGSILSQSMIATSITLIAGLPIVALFAWLAASFYQENRPFVSVQGGILRLRVGRAVKNVRLAECSWYVGSVCETNVMPRKSNWDRFWITLPRDPAVILMLPRDGERVTPRVAVGFGETSQHRWRAFLRLAGVPSRPAPP